MSYSNCKRFLVARFNEAHRLLGDPDTIEDGADILRDLLASRPSPGPWLRMKCHLGLSFYADDFFDAEPPENRSEERAARLPAVGRGLEQSRARINEWRQNIIDAGAAREAQLQDETASQTTQEMTLTENADELASVKDAEKVDDDENIQLAQDSAT
ncbi:hypothetical protein DIS24_g9095 [Lasiodiplodia hormozganensis]|uniref:Uncharacterized protein n=1 Tax=Lasiodiplodia hormozganensis TaxID=869390 RepID=A0AA39XY07_9PEZI|nr:hypothetical protein DIS24_g9095 [Lasiodiplodia hormozganensis]